MFAGSFSASGRRALVVLGVAALLLGGGLSVKAQAQTPAAPAAPAQEPPDALKLTGDFVLLVNQIKPDKAADFESGWAAIKDKLSKSDKPDLKELGDSLKIFKLNTPPVAGAPVIYIFHLNPPSKTQSYDPTKILFYSGAFERAEADAIFKKIGEAYININPWPLVKVIG